MAFADGVTAERSCQNCGIVTNSDIYQRCTTLNACVKFAGVDCQKTALMIQTCVRYIIQSIIASILSLLSLQTLLLLLLQPLVHVCMHFFVIRPAPTRDNDLNRRGQAIKWCAKWTVLLTLETRVLKPFSSVVKEKSPAWLRIIGNDLGVYILQIAFMLWVALSTVLGLYSFIVFNCLQDVSIACHVETKRYIWINHFWIINLSPHVMLILDEVAFSNYWYHKK